jgi:hypothetical protein
VNCKGIFGRLFGHNYQPVFTRTPPDEIKVDAASSAQVARVLEAMTRTAYVHTCCTRCGDVIEAVMP